jgi:hypothetical protein
MDTKNIKRELSDVDLECAELSVDAAGSVQCSEQYELDIVESDVKQEALDKMKQEPSCSYGEVIVSLKLEEKEDSSVVGSSLRLALPDDTRTTELSNTQGELVWSCTVLLNSAVPTLPHSLFLCNS